MVIRPFGNFYSRRTTQHTPYLGRPLRLHCAPVSIWLGPDCKIVVDLVDLFIVLVSMICSNLVLILTCNNLVINCIVVTFPNFCCPSKYRRERTTNKVALLINTEMMKMLITQSTYAQWQIMWIACLECPMELDLRMRGILVASVYDIVLSVILYGSRMSMRRSVAILLKK